MPFKTKQSSLYILHSQGNSSKLKYQALRMQPAPWYKRELPTHLQVPSLFSDCRISRGLTLCWTTWLRLPILCWQWPWKYWWWSGDNRKLTWAWTHIFRGISESSSLGKVHCAFLVLTEFFHIRFCDHQSLHSTECFVLLRRQFLQGREMSSEVLNHQHKSYVLHEQTFNSESGKCETPLGHHPSMAGVSTFFRTSPLIPPDLRFKKWYESQWSSSMVD